jgi:hypothetical protein
LDGLLLFGPFRLGAGIDFGGGFFVEEDVCLESIDARDSLLLRD